METIVPGEQPCPNCGKPMKAGALAGLCPGCLIAQGAATDTEAAPRQAPHFEPPSLEEVAKLFPQLEILALLGAGGMGAVYKARQPALDRLVALKILPAARPGVPSHPERFSREARALARLHHPNIVAVHEFGEAGGLHFFIMEFVDGANLRQLEKAGRLSPREALQIIPQICDALQYAHDEGVVHRDIKPENVLVDRKGRVKIADFGLAKIAGTDGDTARLTAEGQVMGTPHYMAPEQVERPLAVDHRADIYALGVVFYEMLTGDLPIGKFSPPSRKVEVDVRLDEVVLRALENDPERRYQRASEVKTHVESISGTPPPMFPSTPFASSAASVSQAGRQIHWQGFVVVEERGGRRALHWKGVLAAVALVFGVLTVAFGFVSAITGRSVLGLIGVIGWPSVIARLVLAALLVTVNVRRRFHGPWDDRFPRTPQGTVILEQRPPWWRRPRIVIPVLLLLLAVWGISEARRNRLGWPGSDADIKISHVAKKDKTGLLRAKLASGGSVELLGISDAGAWTDGWWSADGTPLGRAGFEIRAATDLAARNRVSKDLLFRTADLPAGSALAGIQSDNAAGFASGGQALRNGTLLEGALPARLAWPHGTRKADVNIGFATDPWRIIGTMSPNGTSRIDRRHWRDPAWKVQFHSQPVETRDGVLVSLLFGPGNRMWVHQVTAVDTNGVEHVAATAQGSPIETINLWTYTFNGLHSADVKEFRVEVRRVHWVQFADVAVVPGKHVPKPAPSSFTAVMETGGDQALDFDTGRSTNYPMVAEDHVMDRNKSIESLRQDGFDALAGRAEIQPLDMDLVALEGADWDTLKPAELTDRVYRNYYRPGVIKANSSNLPITLGFRTREHGVGMLQVVSATNSSALAIQYKMVQRRREP